MTLEEFYTEIHGDLADARGRFMSDAMVTRFVPKFLKDPTMAALRDAVEANDYSAVFSAVHTLKGVAANLSFSELSAVASDLTEQMRSLDSAPDPVLLAKVEESYKLVVDNLTEFTQQ